MKTIISASILSADLRYLGDEMERTERSGADYIHFDVMDGAFVNNISFGFPVLKAVKQSTSLPVDLHLMTEAPSRYIERFAEKGADIITFHLEAEKDIRRTASLIHSLGKKAGIAIKPSTPVSELLPFIDIIDMALVMTVEPGFGGQGLICSTEEKIRELRKYSDSAGLSLNIEVDGGINADTAKSVIADGANVLVAGSYLYRSEDMAGAVRLLRSYAGIR